MDSSGRTYALGGGGMGVRPHSNCGSSTGTVGAIVIGWKPGVWVASVRGRPSNISFTSQEDLYRLSLLGSRGSHCMHVSCQYLGNRNTVNSLEINPKQASNGWSKVQNGHWAIKVTTFDRRTNGSE